MKAETKRNVNSRSLLVTKEVPKLLEVIGDGLGIAVNTARRCVDRYLESGINLAYLMMSVPVVLLR